MIYLDGLPEPPEGSRFWNETTLAGYITTTLATLQRTALDARPLGATKEDWEFLGELTKALALRAWQETEKGG